MTHDCVGIDYKLKTKASTSNTYHHSHKFEFHFYIMNVPSSPPPAYAEVRQTSPIQQSNPNWFV
jgi:hypothetical protein